MKKKQDKQPVFNRRSFISRSAVMAAASMLGVPVVFANKLPKGMSLIGFDAFKDAVPPGKSKDLLVLNDRPWNVETPPHLLDPKVTPADVFFVRNNGMVPENISEEDWTLTIEGEAVKQSKTYSLKELKSKFEQYSYHLVLECGGNGRSEFNPGAKGNQWSLGAVGCSKWTGVRLKDVLSDVGIDSKAVYIGYYGADTHLSGDSKKVVISRGVPISKALEEESLIAWAMNDAPLPLMNGYPLRLVFGGWPASTSGKWLNRIVVRDQVHDGPKMKGYSYRVPKNPVAPGTKVAEEDMKIIGSMPVKSLITYPKTGAIVKGARVFEVRGQAWAGDNVVAKVDISIDFGATWISCQLEKAVNRLAWQRFSCQLNLPKEGYYEIWAKATDNQGTAQPMVVPNWNPKGYLNNACHRIAVKRVES